MTTENKTVYSFWPDPQWGIWFVFIAIAIAYSPMGANACSGCEVTEVTQTP
jgi:hypothetical protein